MSAVINISCLRGSCERCRSTLPAASPAWLTRPLPAHPAAAIRQTQRGESESDDEANGRRRRRVSAAGLGWDCFCCEQLPLQP